MELAYAGIDVACAKKKALPISVCVKRGAKLVPLELKSAPLDPPRGEGNVLALEPRWRADFAAQTVAYLRGVEQTFAVQIARLALDAPSEPCPPNLTRRRAERALDERRISCFTTPSEAQFATIVGKARAHLRAGGAQSRLPHANQLWMLVGFALFRRLSALWPCLEVYPQATVALLGCGAVHKSQRSGLTAQLRVVGQRLGWADGELEDSLYKSGFGKRHDQFDAYLAAWVASLDESDREPLGTPPRDAIWVPQFTA